jgi:sugar phosphate permease
LREEYGLSLAQVGVVLAAEWLGALLTLLPWGLLADRVGERRVLASGLAACGVFLVLAGRVESFAPLFALLFLAGAAGASVNAASGRAVMGWFGAAERGFALGIRQTAIPVGGVFGALVLPALSVEGAFAALGVFCLAGAVVGALVVREPPAPPPSTEAELGWTLRDGRLWRLCGGSAFYLTAQIAVMSFVVLYLHDERGLGKREAAAVLAAVQVGAAVLRIAAGRWSDVLRSRVVPLRRIGLAVAASVGLATALLDAPLALLVPAFVVGGALSMAWNGLSFAAAAELAGRARSGAAIGVQQSTLSAFGVVIPIAFAALASGSWHLAYALAAVGPLVGWVVLRPLRDR